MPSLISNVLRSQLRIIRPLLGKGGIIASRNIQEKLGELGAKVNAGSIDYEPEPFALFEAAWAKPKSFKRGKGRVILYLHGGGYVAGDINYAKGFGGIIAVETCCRVLCVAYRLAPEHPYPAALEDALTSYRFLLDSGYKSKDIALCGESAGGGLIYALLLKLMQYGLPLPYAMVGISPWVDQALTGASYTGNQKKDPSLYYEMIECYVKMYGAKDVYDPFVSPLYGNFYGAPPSLLFAGSDELLLDDAVALDKKLKSQQCPSFLHVEDGMWHGYVLFGVPEAQEALSRMAIFLEEVHQ
ncbi:MAG: alpha/beta hydrolase [Christensenellales bacterium]|jgi:monoterpene epsilon-lactone hydrolase